MSGIVVFIAQPGSAALDDAALAIIQGFLPGAPVWLAAGEACEFAIGTPMGAVLEQDLRAALAPRPVDIAVLPSHNRRKRLLLADMDSTMILEETIDELARLAGVADRVSAITQRAMRGEVAYEKSLIERVALLRDTPAAAITAILAGRLTLREGGPTLVATMRRHGAYTALISGGFAQFTGEIARRLAFDTHRANSLIIEHGRLTGEVALPILGSNSKAEALAELCAMQQIEPDEAIAVGDGANDATMLQRAGLGVAMHGKQAARDAAAVHIDHGDLTALLYLQGYRQAEFVAPSIRP